MDLTKRIEVNNTPRDRLYGVELSRLRLNLIVRFVEHSNAIVGNWCHRMVLEFYNIEKEVISI